MLRLHSLKATSFRKILELPTSDYIQSSEKKNIAKHGFNDVKPLGFINLNIYS